MLPKNCCYHNHIPVIGPPHSKTILVLYLKYVYLMFQLSDIAIAIVLASVWDAFDVSTLFKERH